MEPLRPLRAKTEPAVGTKASKPGTRLHQLPTLNPSPRRRNRSPAPGRPLLLLNILKRPALRPTSSGSTLAAMSITAPTPPSTAAPKLVLMSQSLTPAPRAHTPPITTPAASRPPVQSQIQESCQTGPLRVARSLRDFHTCRVRIKNQGPPDGRNERYQFRPSGCRFIFDSRAGSLPLTDRPRSAATAG